MLLIPALIYIGVGCSHLPKNQGSPAVPNQQNKTGKVPWDSTASSAELDERTEAHARFLAGLSLDQNQLPEEALAEYEKALAADPRNEDLATELSRRHLQRKDYDKAIAVLKKTAATPGASGLASARLSFIYLQQGKTNDAISASREAIKQDPGLMAGYQSLFHLYRSLGQTNEARKVVEQAARQPKPDAPFLIDLGHLCLVLSAERPNDMNSPSRLKARETLLRAADLENTNVVSLQRLAQGFMFLGETRRAADVYLKMLEEEPDLPGIREALAELYLRQNDSKRAAEQLREIIRDSPTNPQAHYFLAAIAYEEKRFGDALDSYRRALLLGLDNEQIYFDIAATHLALNQPRDALSSLEKARKKFRPSFVGEFYTGLAYMRLKEFTNALDHFTAAEIVAKATDTNRLTHIFFFELGAAYERAGKISESERYFEKCLVLSPNFAEALNYLGYMWAERGTNLDLAHEYIARAVKLNPTNAAYLDSLGWVLFKQGRPEEALGPIRQSVELSEEPDATLLDHLGDIYAALRDLPKAREAWQKSIQIQPSPEVERKLKNTDPPPPGRER